MTDATEIELVAAADEGEDGDIEVDLAGKRVDFETAMTVLTGAGAPPAPETIDWPEDLLALNNLCFASWSPLTAPYRFEELLREAFDSPEEEALLIGYDGYGVNSWAFHLVWRRGALLIGFQTATGGAMMTARTGHDSVAASWDMLRRFEAAAEKAPQEKILAVIDSDIGANRWTWLDRNGDWDGADWTETPIAGLAALTAIEAL